MLILNGMIIMVIALFMQLPNIHAQVNACNAQAVATCAPYTCVQTDTVWSCLCPTGTLAQSAAACGTFISSTFPTINNQCGNTICPSGGTCVLTNQVPQQYVCICPNGILANPDCPSTPLPNNPCLYANPCTNGGTCVVNPLTLQAICLCPPNTYGANCAALCRTTCDYNWCYNGGRCSNVYGQAYCSCAQNYRGRRCELRYNPYNYVYLYQTPYYGYGKK